MSKRKKIYLIPVYLIVIALIGVLGLVYFFYSNEAPITQGKIRYAIEYKSGRKLDIYFPTQKIFDKSPIVLFIHGGAWIGGRKEAININRINDAVNKLRDEGYTIISPEYTLAKSNHSPFPDCIKDGFDAIWWISKNADSLNLDLNYFGVIGESAGGHIAMMNAFANPSDFGLNYPKVPMDYVVDIYGPNDLDKLYHMKTIDSLNHLLEKLPTQLQEKLDLPKYLFGFDPKKEPLKAKQFTDKYSPVRYINKSSPRVLMIHGDKDQIVPLEQSLRLKSKLDSQKIENEIHVLEGVDHAFKGISLNQKSNIQTWIVNFILSGKQ